MHHFCSIMVFFPTIDRFVIHVDFIWTATSLKAILNNFLFKRLPMYNVSITFHDMLWSHWLTTQICCGWNWRRTLLSGFQKINHQIWQGLSHHHTGQKIRLGLHYLKQDHRRWRYHRRLWIIKVHRITGIIQYLGSSNSFGSLKSILSFEMTLRPSDHERQC